MLEIGVQTKNIIEDQDPENGFALLKKTGFGSVDFSLNSYLSNTDLYEKRKNSFFDPSIQELEAYFAAYKAGAAKNGIRTGQMHMPYPIFVPGGSEELNQYLWQQVAPKSMGLCAYLECPYIVVHGLKLIRFLGTEEAEWEQTERFLDSIAPMAKEMGITICIENLYDSLGRHLVEGPCCNARKAVERIDRMNEKYHAEVLGFCFDTGHANLAGIDCEEFIAMLGNRLKVLHIHDNDGVRDLHQIPFTFTRTRENLPSTDWDGFIRGLQKIKYDKVLSFETAPVLRSFPGELKEDVLDMLAKIGRYFIQQIQKTKNCARMGMKS